MASEAVQAMAAPSAARKTPLKRGDCSGGRPSAARLARLLRPRSIAVVGGREAARVIEQCERMGFAGELWPVHGRRRTLAGRPAVPNPEALPGPPDAAFVAVNRVATVEVVRTLSRLGAGGAVCYASGFLEAADGAALQGALVEAAADMPIVGPNCYGLINFLDGAPLWPDQHGGRRLAPAERGAAILTQSSNIAVNISMQRRGLPLAYLVTVGNQAQLGLSSLAAALLEDQRVSALGLHVEGFDSVAGFEALAGKARERGTPVVVLKAGRSEQGRAAALSHTASLTGSDAGAEALLRRLGFARAQSIPELLEALKFLHVHGPLAGSRLGALCCSGGEAGLLADAAEGAAARFPELTLPQAAAVQDTAHPLVTVANPFDYHTFDWGNEAALRRTFSAFARCGFDANLIALDFPRADRCEDADWEITLTAFEQAMADTESKGALVASLAENLPEEKAQRMMARGIAPLAGLGEALCAIECAAAIGAAWRSPLPAPVLLSAPGPGAPILLDEAAAKARLAAWGVPVPPGGVARDEDQAAALAESLGGALAVKALGIAHKTERDAVRLGLRGAQEVRAAARILLGVGERVLVERFVPGLAAELLVGLHRDSELGLLLTLGAGGALVELLRDRVALLLPVDEAQVRGALARLRCAPILEGHRGRPPADLDGAVAAILAIAGHAAQQADLVEELDINPLGVAPVGGGAMALDALLRIRETAEP